MKEKLSLLRHISGIHFKKLEKPILLSIVLAVALTAIIILLLPPVNKYRLDILQVKNYEKTKQYTYYDQLDNTDHYYRIRAIYNSANQADIIIYDDKDIIVNDITFGGRYIRYGSRLFFFDTDHDGTKEIYAFTADRDTLWLKIVPDFRQRPYDVKKVFVSRINQYTSEEDYSIKKGVFLDFDQDSHEDFIFSVTAGYSLQPRKIFLYLPVKDTLITSPDFADAVNDFFVADNNHDGYPEVSLSNYATNNYDTASTFPYLDNSAWLMALDHHLRFLFPPLKKKGYTAFFQTVLYHSGARPVIAALDGCHTEQDTIYHLTLVTYHGRELRQIAFNQKEDPPEVLFSLEAHPDYLYLILRSGRILKMDSLLREVASVDIHYYPLQPLFIKDLDQDGKNEMVFISDYTLIVTNEDLQKLVTLKLPELSTRYIPYLNTYRDNKDQPVFSIGYGYYHFSLKFTRKPYYFLKYFAYLGIFLLIFLALLFLMQFQHAATLARYEKEKKILELQYQNIKTQMDPHFTFNVLNSVATYIYKEKKEDAYNYLVKFSKLIRETIENADNIFKTLQEELAFTVNYLELQRVRFKNKLDYEIDIEENIDREIKVPGMIIQTYVENALKHGLRHTNKKGLIQIKLKQKDALLYIDIIDNGIGREKAREKSLSSTKKGHKLINQLYELINKNNDLKIQCDIIDLYDGKGNPSGTRVSITLPVRINTNI